METSTAKKKGEMDMQARMQVYMKLGTPGAPHQLLGGMAGSWATKTKAWMDPTQPPMESAGSAEQAMILGGRFLRQEFTGDMMGGVYNGIGFTGYSNHSKKYVSTWMDSSSTDIMYFEGTGSADGKTITLETGYYEDPFRGQMKWRSVTKVVDDRTWMFELYGVDKKGKAERMIEITYTRK